MAVPASERRAHPRVAGAPDVICLASTPSRALRQRLITGFLHDASQGGVSFRTHEASVPDGDVELLVIDPESQIRLPRRPARIVVVEPAEDDPRASVVRCAFAEPTDDAWLGTIATAEP